MFRSLRRWWAGITHRHEYEVIWRGFILWKDKLGSKGRNPCVLKRCYCGHELCQEYEFGKWTPKDLEWFNHQIWEKDFDIPARTHGLKS